MSNQKTRVMVCMPSRGSSANAEAVFSHYGLASGGKTQILPAHVSTSLLAHGFNTLWAAGLDWVDKGLADYWLLHHDDIVVRNAGWVDLMVAEAERVGAAVLSVVVPIKDDSGTTSTAVDAGPHRWAPRRLTMRECWELPRTFGAADTQWPDKPLLVNTGLMLVDARRPEFRTVVEGDDGPELAFKFQIRDRVAPRPDGGYVAQVRPEDWEFSRTCHAHGVPVYATTAIQCVHHGDMGWPNFKPEEAHITP